MNRTAQTVQEQRPANFAALHQSLQEMAACEKSSVPTTKETPVVVQGPVIVVRGK